MKIAALSDLHGNLPILPKDVDVVILGGDLFWDKYLGEWAKDNPSVQRANYYRELRPWIEANGTPTLGTYGNHDWLTLDLLDGDIGVDLAVDRLIEFRGVKFWFSPWSPTFMHWNWMKADHEDGLGKVYAQIPNDVDVLVSHSPPYGYGDKAAGTHSDECPLRWHLGGDPDKCTCGCTAHLGSRELLKAIQRVKPRVVICGHIHGGYGNYVIDVCPHGTDGSVSCACRAFHQVRVFNVSVVDEAYKLVNPVTVIEL